MALQLGIIADDITGGLETAGMLVAEGVRCAFVTTPEAALECENYDAIVIALKTRVLPAEQAVRDVRAAAQALIAKGARQLFFKYCATFDSTDDGNIGPCADCLKALVHADIVGFCPAFPDAGRTVFRAHLFVFDDLVSNSSKRFDPLTPMTDPRLVDVLGRQTRHGVGRLHYDVIAAGAEACEAQLHAQRESGKPYIIFDALGNADLARLAALTVDWPLMTGNSSIVAHYPALWRARGQLLQAPPRPLPAVQASAVVLAGSCSERTREQLAAFAQRYPVYSLDLAAVHDEAAAAAQVLEWALPRLQQGYLAISTSRTSDDVAKAQQRHGPTGAAALAEAILARVARRLFDAGARRFLVAGGETSGAILKGLALSRLDVGPYRELGVGVAVSRSADPAALCLKSGKLGAIDMFAKVLDAMSRPLSMERE